MASATVFAGVRRRGSPLAGAFHTPEDLTGLALVQSLAYFSADLVTAYSGQVTAFPFQRKNTRSLLLKVKIFLSLSEFLRDSPSSSSSLYLPSTSVCLRELYILLFRSRLLLDYCSQSSRLWLLIQNPQISGHFHDLNQEFATIIDVLPIGTLNLAPDLQEHLQLLQLQLRRSKLYIDLDNEILRFRILSFLDEFGKGIPPNLLDLQTVFFDRLGIKNAQTCRSEIEFLEEEIHSNEEDDADPSVFGGIVALTRYYRFSQFGFLDERGELEKNISFGQKYKRRVSFKDISSIVPKDFCCPISLDVMSDPVTISTGQTYDRPSISQWIEEGHQTCPYSGLALTHKRLIPNLALRSLISQWFCTQGLEYDVSDCSDASTENIVAASSSRAAIEANMATARILVSTLGNGSELDKTIAARELRLLAKTGKENRASIAEAGAIPLLHKLLCSPNAMAQENSVTAILNLSIYDQNKGRIMEEEGCLKSIVDVLRNGQTTESRENAAATLFSLTAVHNYKKRISDEPGALEALVGLLRNQSPRGKRDAAMALFNLSTHSECCSKMMESGAVWALVDGLSMAGVAEEASGALALLMRQRVVVEVVGMDDRVFEGLAGVMRSGTHKAKENAVSALHEMCKTGGGALTQSVAGMPSLRGLIQNLMLTGTKRARRKAASLARTFLRCEAEMAAAGGAAGMDMEYEMMRGISLRRSSSFVGRDVSVPVAVPVL